MSARFVVLGHIFSHQPSSSKGHPSTLSFLSFLTMGAVWILSGHAQSVTQHVLKVCLKVSVINCVFKKRLWEQQEIFFFPLFLQLRQLRSHSVGADGLPCLMITAIVWLGLVLKVLVHVHVVVSVGGVAWQFQGSDPADTIASAAGLGLNSVRALNDRVGRFRAGGVAGAIWGQVWGWRGCRCHGYGARVNSNTGWGATKRDRWLRPEKGKRGK